MLIILLVFTILMGGAFGAYQFRQDQKRNEALACQARGVEAFDAGDYEVGLDQIGRYLAVFQDDTEALYKYAVCRLEVPLPKGRHLLHAVGVFRRVISDDPTHEPAQRKLMALYEVLDYNAEQIDLCREFLNTHKGDAEASRHLLRASARVKAYDEMGLFAEQCARNDDAVTAVYALDLLLATGEQGRVIDISTRLIDRHEDTDDISSIDLLRVRAEAHHVIEAWQQAANGATRFLAARPAHLRTQVLLFDALKHLGTSAAELVTRAESLRADYPEDPRFVLLQAHACQLAERRAEALTLLKQAARADYDSLWDALFLIKQLDGNGLQVQSLSVLRRLADEEIDGASTELIRRLWELGRYDDVIAATPLRSLDPSTPRADVGRLAFVALSLIALERVDDALRIIDALGEREFESRSPAWAAVLRPFAESASPLDLVRACEAAASALPNEAAVRYLLGNAYARLGELRLAVGAWAEAARLRPAWAAPRLSASKAYEQMGDRDGALRFAASAAHLAPNNIDAALTLIEARAAALTPTDKEQAAALLDSIKSLHPALEDDALDETVRTMAIERLMPVEVALLARTERRADAVKLIDAQFAAGDDHAPSAAVLLRLARLSRAHQLEREQPCFDRAEALYGAAPELQYARAVDLALQDRRDEAVELIERSVDEHRASLRLDTHLAMARFVEAIDPKRAEPLWRPLLAKHPNDLQVLQLVTRAESILTDDRAMQQTVDRMRRLTGDDALGWRLAQVRWLIASEDEARAEQAAAVLDPIIRQHPGLIEARLLRAAAAARRRDVTQLVRELDTVMRDRPEAHGLALRLARILQETGDFAGANATLERVMRSPNVDEATTRQVAAVHARQGNHERAMEILRQLNKPDLLLVQLHIERGELEQADRLCRELLTEPTPAVIETAAQIATRLGEPDEAAAILQRLGEPAVAEQLQPGDRHAILAAHHERIGEHDLALDHRRHAVEQAPANGGHHRRLIDHFVVRGEVEQAVAAVKTASERASDDEAVRFLAARIDLLRFGASVESIRPLVSAMIHQPARREATADALALLRDAEGDHQVSDAFVGDLLKLTEAHGGFLVLRNVAAELLLRHGHVDEARTLATTTRDAFPADARSAELVAHCCLRLNQPAQTIVAADEWRRRSAADPRRAELFIAEAQLAQGKFKAALGTVEPHVEAALQSPEQHGLTLSIFAEASFRADRAVALKERLQPLATSSPAQWTALGLKAPEPAVTRAWLLDAKPLSLNDRTRLGNAWVQLAQRSKNAADLTRGRAIIEAVTADTNAPADAWILRGMLAESVGNTDAAAAFYRRALNIDATAHAACNNLAMILAQDPATRDEARRLANEAVKLAPQTGNYWDTLAHVEAAAGRMSQAANHMARAIQRDPGNRAWLERYADYLDAADRRNEASDVRQRLFKDAIETTGG